MTERARETEETPAMEVHLGEVHTDHGTPGRHCVIWLNGKRWEGHLSQGEPGT